MASIFAACAERLLRTFARRASELSVFRERGLLHLPAATLSHRRNGAEERQSVNVAEL